MRLLCLYLVYLAHLTNLVTLVLYVLNDRPTHPAMTYVLAIDVEASGRGLTSHFMTQFGAALVAPDGTLVATFGTHLPQPAGTGWEQRCLDEFWLKPANAKRYEETLAAVAVAKPRHESMAAFRQWVLQVTAGKRCIVVFDTASFDGAWMDLYLGDTSCLYLLGHYQETWDLSSYMAGAAGVQPLHGSESKAWQRRYGTFPPMDAEHDHDPRHDATVIGQRAAFVFRTMAALPGAESMDV